VIDGLKSQTCCVFGIRPCVETAAPRITLLTISASALEAAPTSSQFIVGVGNDLLDRVINGRIMCQVIDDAVKPNIQGFQVAELELTFKELGCAFEHHLGITLSSKARPFNH
jgi:hypothetical protein